MARKQKDARKPGVVWGIVAGFVAIAFIGGLFVALWPKPASTPPAPTSSTQAAATIPTSDGPTPGVSTSPVATTAGSGDCPALSTNNAFPIQAPTTEWQAHPGGMYLPVSKEYGPAKQEGRFWRCFSRTPSGAVFAGLTLSFDFSSGVKDAAADGPDRESQWKVVQEATKPASWPRMTGFRVTASSPDAATIDYMATVGDQRLANRVTLVWDKKAADWRMGKTSFLGEISDPTTFTMWQ